MRLSKTEVDRREKLATDYFTRIPSATGSSFNDFLTNSGEKRMNIKRVYEIRARVRSAVSHPDVQPEAKDVQGVQG